MRMNAQVGTAWYQRCGASLVPQSTDVKPEERWRPARSKRPGGGEDEAIALGVIATDDAEELPYARALEIHGAHMRHIEDTSRAAYGVMFANL